MVELIQFPSGNLKDIPSLLESLARQIRDGELGSVTCGTGVFLSGDQVIVCGWGDTDGVHSIGVLQIGAAWLADKVVTR